MLDGLDAIDWTHLTHAYGPAVDVPGQLRDLAGGDREARRRARWSLYGNIFHQGTRYPATAAAIPFLVTMLADPAVAERHELAILLAHLVTGQLGVAAEPVVYTGEPDLAAASRDDAEYAAILRDCYRAAERGLPVYLGLLAAPDAALRGAAAYLLACLWTRAATVLPALHARLADERDPRARALLAFALGRLEVPGAAPEPRLAALLAGDPAPVVRLVAAAGLVRLHGEHAPPAAVDVLVAALDDPQPFVDYEELPCGEHDVAGDVGHVVRALPRGLARRALPALCAALQRAEDFSTVGLVEALLAIAFDGAEDRSEATCPIDPARLTPEQRAALTAMARTHEMWTIGNLMFVLRAHGLPTTREEMAALVGVDAPRDHAAELAAQGRFFLARMHDPTRAVPCFEQAARLRPDDPLRWLQLGEAQLAAGRTVAALAALDRALALAPGDGRAHFHRAQALVETDPAAAAAAYARAAAAGFSPGLARCNEATALALAGDREAALVRLAALVAAEPEFAEGWYAYGLALVKTGAFAAAIAATTRAIALRDDHANSYYTRACARALVGLREEALADVARAIELEPDLRDEIAEDPDFARLADDPAFLRLVAWDEDDAPPLALRN